MGEMWRFAENTLDVKEAMGAGFADYGALMLQAGQAPLGFSLAIPSSEWNEFHLWRKIG